jgi:hypothetical protein
MAPLSSLSFSVARSVTQHPKRFAFQFNHPAIIFTATGTNKHSLIQTGDCTFLCLEMKSNNIATFFRPSYVARSRGQRTLNCGRIIGAETKFNKISVVWTGSALRKYWQDLVLPIDLEKFVER